MNAKEILKATAEKNAQKLHQHLRELYPTATVGRVTLSGFTVTEALPLECTFTAPKGFTISMVKVEVKTITFLLIWHGYEQ